MDNVPYLNEAVAVIVRELRVKSGYTQEQLAGFAKTSRSQIAQLETGQRGVTLSSLFWLAESFNVPFMKFLGMIHDERLKLQK